MTRESLAKLSIDKTGVQTNEYQYLVSALIQSGWLLLETSVLTRRSSCLDDIWRGIKLVMRQASSMDPISHLWSDFVSSESMDNGVPYPYSDQHPRALDSVEIKPLP